MNKERIIKVQLNCLNPLDGLVGMAQRPDEDTEPLVQQTLIGHVLERECGWSVRIAADGGLCVPTSVVHLPLIQSRYMRKFMLVVSLFALVLPASGVHAYETTLNCKPGVSSGSLKCTELTYPGQREDELSALRSALKTSPQLSGAAYLRKLLQDGLKGKTTDQRAAVSTSVETATIPNQIPNIQVPSVVERLFQQVYVRKITTSESTYWKARVRKDKKTETVLKGAMEFHKSKGISH